MCVERRDQPDAVGEEADRRRRPAILAGLVARLGSRRMGIALALLAVYLIWGSTYLGIRYAIQTIPPLFMTGVRFVFAGSVLYLFLRLRGAARPSRREWLGGGALGVLFLGFGMGGTAFAEQYVASGLAAVVIASMPIWAALFAGLLGRWPGRVQGVGLVLGIAGVGMLNVHGGLQAQPVGAAALLLAACCWAFGTVWSSRLSLPPGQMATAVEMLMGGAVVLVVGMIVTRGHVSAPSVRSVMALLYLVVFGSLVAFSAYGYLLRRVRPAVATSYAYVNPAIAVALGAVIAGERVTGLELVAMVVIVSGVGLVLLGRSRDG